MREKTRAESLRRGVATLALIAGCVVWGCASTDVGNPALHDTSADAGDAPDAAEAATIVMQFEGGSYGPAPVSEKEDGDGRPVGVPQIGGSPQLTLKALWLVVGQLQTTPTASCAEAGGDGLEGVFAVELVSGQELPRPPALEATAGSQCRLELELRAVDGATLPEGSPAALAGRSVLVIAEHLDGSQVMIGASLDRWMRFTFEDGLEVQPGEQSLIFATSLESFTGGLLQLAIQTPGEAFISAHTHPEIIDLLITALERDVSLVFDQDSSQSISGAEWQENHLGQGLITSCPLGVDDCP